MRPSQRVTAGVMAFGAGALLAALTLELVHEAIQKLHGGFWPIGAGCVLGGLAFYVLNHHLNKIGGFLRKSATLMKQAAMMKRRRIARTINLFSRVPLLNGMPPEEIAVLASHVRERQYPAGDRIVREGDPAREMYVVEEGKLEVLEGTNRIADLAAGDVFGEMAILESRARRMSVVAKTNVRVIEMHKQDFERLMKVSAVFADEIRKLHDVRTRHLHDVHKSVGGSSATDDWAERASQSVSAASYQPSASDIHDVVADAKKHLPGAPMAIWLGIFLDGIPESAVIGANMIGEASVSLALIAGLFLANFPESMSSAVGMRKMGMSNWKVTWLWSSLCLMTGVGALIGNLTFQGVSPEMLAFSESLAAGAMLAMIAETMLPEAYEQGGAVVGISTILGFLSAVFVKTLH